MRTRTWICRDCVRTWTSKFRVCPACGKPLQLLCNVDLDHERKTMSIQWKMDPVEAGVAKPVEEHRDDG